jgi:hypothetical protein
MIALADVDKREMDDYLADGGRKCRGSCCCKMWPWIWPGEESGSRRSEVQNRIYICAMGDRYPSRLSDAVFDWSKLSPLLLRSLGKAFFGPWAGKLSSHYRLTLEP